MDTLAFVDLTRGFFGEPTQISSVDFDDTLAELLTSKYLHQYLIKKDWGNMRALLVSLGDKAGQLLSPVFAVEYGSCVGSNFLHTVCSCNIPIDIVQMIVGLCPSLISERDSHGQTPLHVAVQRAGRGSSIAIVRFLLSQHPAAAMAKDREGMTPLMHACGRLKNHFLGRSSRGKQVVDAKALDS